MTSIDTLAQKLVPHYSYFNVGERLLFTGHSHQAWPDVAFEGQKEAFLTAAELVDSKWTLAFEKAEKLRNYLRKFYDDPDGWYSLSSNTHNLLVRWLSALDLQHKPRIITTDSEFHSMNRQLTRLEEEGIEVIRVPALPLDGFSERIQQVVDNKTAAIMISHVYFNSALINSELKEVAIIARKHGISLLIDDYHGANVVPISLKENRLEDCFLLIGGYKYLQWGEGNCFLRYPQDCELRPVITGWFAAFNQLDHTQSLRTMYDDGNNRFMGATYDPTSQFRAAKVVDFFEQMELTPGKLYIDYQNKISLLRDEFLDLDINPEIIRLKHDYSINRNAGFLALVSPFSGEICTNLRNNGVMTDYRSDTLRFGPAPYTTSSQIKEVMFQLKRTVQNLNVKGEKNS